MRIRAIIPLLIILLATVASTPGVIQAQQGGDPYARLVRRALTEIGVSCANLEDNSACYGFPSVTASFSDPALDTSLGAPGDRAPLTQLQTLTTSPLDVNDDQYGVAVLNVRANLPKALPWGAVFTLLGDVEITNGVAEADALVLPDPVEVETASQVAVLAGPGADAAELGVVRAGTALQADAVSPDGEWVRVMYENGIGWVSRAALDPAADLSTLPVVTADSKTPMQVFTFRTGGDTPPSLAIPPSVLIVQSPEDAPIDIVANGVPLRIDGVAFLRTLPDGRMQLIAANGSSYAYPDDPDELFVVTGTSVIFGQDGEFQEWRVLGPEELDPYDDIVRVRDDIINYKKNTVIKPSGIPGPPIIIITPGGREIIPGPPHRRFPVVPFTVTTPGEPLEELVWEPLAIGCGACLPDRVFYHSDVTGDWDIYQLTAQGFSEPANNVSRSPRSEDIQPSYSADGAWVAFTSNRDILGGWEIYISSVDGLTQQRLTFNTGNDVNPVFGPAQYVAWESSRTGNWDLFMADVATDGQPVQLTDDPANDVNPFWFPNGGCDQPDGARLVFQSDRDGDWEIFMLDVLSGELTQLTSNTVPDQVPVLSADGSQMAWLEQNEFGAYDLWLMDLATQQTRRLTDLGVSALGPTFSEDGQYVAFYARAGRDTEIMLVDLATDTVQAVTDNDVMDSAPSFYCDRPEIVYQSDMMGTPENGGQLDLYQVNPLPVGGPANLPDRLTQDEGADDIYVVSSPRDEVNSKLGRLLGRP